MTDYDSKAAGKKCSIMVFAGKGGVGKTTCAATTALHYASLGKKTLAVSTDATPSLSHIFEIKSSGKLADVKDSLYVNELGVAEVKEMWDKKFGREVYEVFSSIVAIDYETFVEFMTSLLPGLSDEFMVDYIRGLSREGTYDAIIWDTAPLGQTLTLLETPAMLRKHLKMAPRIYSRLKLGQVSKEPILDILKRWERLSADNIRFLQHEVDFTMVTIPEALAVEQLQGVFAEMGKYGLKLKRMIVNNVVKAEGSSFLLTKSQQQRQYLDLIYQKYPDLSIIELPMFPYEIKGLERIREVGRVLFSDC